MSVPANHVRVFLTFPHPVLEVDSERYLRRTTLAALCDVGYPEAVGPCLILTFQQSTLESGKAQELLTKIDTELRELAVHDGNIFPGIDRQKVAAMPAKPLAAMPELDTERQPVNIDWGQSAPVTSDDNMTPEQYEQHVAELVNKVVQFCIWVNTAPVKTALQFRADLSPVRQSAFVSMLNQLENIGSRPEHEALVMSALICENIFAIESVNELLRLCLPNYLGLLLAEEVINYFRLCGPYGYVPFGDPEVATG